MAFLSGGDAFLSQCLWEHGFAHTTPDPLWHPQKMSMFDPSPPGLNPDDYIIWKATHVLGNMLQKAAGVCSGLCQVFNSSHSKANSTFSIVVLVALQLQVLMGDSVVESNLSP